MRSGRGRSLLFPLERGAPREFGIEMERVLGPPIERAVINVDEAEPSAVAEPPLEIVEERPHEITAHWYSGGDRIEHRAEIVAQIRDARRVVDPFVRLDPVGERCTVLEDVNRQIAAIALLRFEHHRTERVGRNLPAHLGDRGPRCRWHDADLKGMVGIMAHPRSRVVVDREIIRLASYYVEVARLYELLHFCGERFGIVAVDLRIGERAVP